MSTEQLEQVDISSLSKELKGDPFNPEIDIPSLQNKVILITGANTGLGKESAIQLAKHDPAEIWMTARDKTKGEKAAADVKKICPTANVKLLELDLNSFDSVKAAAKTFLASASRLDVLFLNAGILGAPQALTKDGYEIHWGVNHMSHALLLKLLTPILLITAAKPGSDVRVIHLSSTGHKFCRVPIMFNLLREAGGTSEGFSQVDRYAHTKLANLLYARQFAEHYPQLKSVSVHPGNVATELFEREAGDAQTEYLQKNIAPKVGISIEDGAKNQLWAATAAAVKTGEYYEPVGVLDQVEGFGKDDKLAKELWKYTEKELAGHSI